jgi:hypothetical protein
VGAGNCATRRDLGVDQHSPLAAQARKRAPGRSFLGRSQLAAAAAGALHVAMLIDALTFVVSLASLAGVRRRYRADDPAGHPPAAWRALGAGTGVRAPGRPACVRAALDAMVTRPMTTTGTARSPQRTARRIAGEIWERRR